MDPGQAASLAGPNSLHTVRAPCKNTRYAEEGVAYYTRTVLNQLRLIFYRHCATEFSSDSEVHNGNRNVS
jgi:hypothetical protein